MNYEERKLCPFNTTAYNKPFGKNFTFYGVSTTLGDLREGFKTETVFELCVEEMCMAWDDKKKLCKRLK